MLLSPRVYTQAAFRSVRRFLQGSLLQQTNGPRFPVCNSKKERKGRVFIHRLFAPRYTQSAQAWITQFYMQTISCLPFLRGVHQMSPPQQRTSNCSSLLIYRPRQDERLSWPSWLSYSGWFTHVTHQLQPGRAKDSESTPAEDRCSTAGPHNQTHTTFC